MHMELLIWQILSVAIIAILIYIPLVACLAVWMNNMDFDTVALIAAFLLFPAGILYILAWIFTLVLALMYLRDLPPGAFDTVHWTTFIPHV